MSPGWGGASRAERRRCDGRRWGWALLGSKSVAVDAYTFAPPPSRWHRRLAPPLSRGATQRARARARACAARARAPPDSPIWARRRPAGAERAAARPHRRSRRASTSTTSTRAPSSSPMGKSTAPSAAAAARCAAAAVRACQRPRGAPPNLARGYTPPQQLRMRACVGVDALPPGLLTRAGGAAGRTHAGAGAGGGHPGIDTKRGARAERAARHRVRRVDRPGERRSAPRVAEQPPAVGAQAGRRRWQAAWRGRPRAHQGACALCPRVLEGVRLRPRERASCVRQRAQADEH